MLTWSGATLMSTSLHNDLTWPCQKPVSRGPLGGRCLFYEVPQRCWSRQTTNLFFFLFLFPAPTPSLSPPFTFGIPLNLLEQLHWDTSFFLLVTPLKHLTAALVNNPGFKIISQLNKMFFGTTAGASRGRTSSLYQFRSSTFLLLYQWVSRTQPWCLHSSSLA